jgi:hypothetical protein
VKNILVLVLGVLAFSFASAKDVKKKSTKKVKRTIASAPAGKEYIMALAFRARANPAGENESPTLVLEACNGDVTCIENRLKQVSPSITDIHFVEASSGYLTMKVTSTDPNFIRNSYNGQTRPNSTGISEATIALDKPNCFCGDVRTSGGSYSVPGSDSAGVVEDSLYGVIVDPVGGGNVRQTTISGAALTEYNRLWNATGTTACFLSDVNIVQVQRDSSERPYIAASRVHSVHENAQQCLAAKSALR